MRWETEDDYVVVCSITEVLQASTNDFLRIIYVTGLDLGLAYLSTSDLIPLEAGTAQALSYTSFGPCATPYLWCVL